MLTALLSVVGGVLSAAVSIIHQLVVLIGL